MLFKKLYSYSGLLYKSHRLVLAVLIRGSLLTSFATLAIKGGDPINSQSIKGASGYFS